MLFTYLIIPIVLVAVIGGIALEIAAHRHVFNKLRDQIIIRATITNADSYRDKIKHSGLSLPMQEQLGGILNQTIEAVGYEAAGEIR